MRSSIWRSRLKQLHDRLTRVVDTWTPDEVAVEETFVNKDAQATLKLGQARAMSLLVPAMHSLPVAEYGANQVKKTVVGVGHADKNQVLAMVKILLPKADPKKGRRRRCARHRDLPCPSTQGARFGGEPLGCYTAHPSFRGGRREGPEPISAWRIRCEMPAVSCVKSRRLWVPGSADAAPE